MDPLMHRGPLLDQCFSEAAWLVHPLPSPEQGACSKGTHSLKKDRQMVTNSVRWKDGLGLLENRVEDDE